jgi:uncharacterized protein (TIGR02147 family)
MYLYQKFLKEEFERRVVKNKLYSLRAFSRDLKISSSKLSQYLSGSCGLSTFKAEELAKNLSLNSNDIQIFVTSAEAAHSRSQLSKNFAQDKLSKLLADNFQNIDKQNQVFYSDWYLRALLSIIELDHFQPDLNWISQQMNLSVQQVAEGIEKLVAANYLDCTSAKWSRKAVPVIKFRSAEHDEVLRKKKQAVQAEIIRRHEKNSQDKTVSASMVLVGDDESYEECRKIIIKACDDLKLVAANSKSKKMLHILEIDLCQLV